MNLRQMGLNKSSRICQITHKDLDGVGCAIIMGQVFDNIHRIYCNYNEVDNVASTIIESEDFDFIFFTDICPSKMISLDHDNIVLLDHHSDRVERHRPKYNQYVVEKFCGTTLTKRFVENYFSVKLDNFNDLAYLIQDYDLWKLNNHKSTFLNTLFYYYWEDKFYNRFFRGSTKLNDIEIKYLREKRKEYLSIFDKLQVNLVDNKYFKLAYIEAESYINELCHDSIKQFDLDIIICRNLKKKSVSIRSKSSCNIHLGEVLNKINGGGHKNAAGFSFTDITNATNKCNMFIDMITEIAKKENK